MSDNRDFQGQQDAVHRGLGQPVGDQAVAGADSGDTRQRKRRIPGGQHPMGAGWDVARRGARYRAGSDVKRSQSGSQDAQIRGARSLPEQPVVRVGHGGDSDGCRALGRFGSWRSDCDIPREAEQMNKLGPAIQWGFKSPLPHQNE